MARASTFALLWALACEPVADRGIATDTTVVASATVRTKLSTPEGNGYSDIETLLGLPKGPAICDRTMLESHGGRLLPLQACWWPPRDGAGYFSYADSVGRLFAMGVTWRGSERELLRLSDSLVMQLRRHYGEPTNCVVYAADQLSEGREEFVADAAAYVSLVWRDQHRRIGILTDSTDASSPTDTVDVRVVAVREPATAVALCETEFPSNPNRVR